MRNINPKLDYDQDNRANAFWFIIENVNAYGEFKNHLSDVLLPETIRQILPNKLTMMSTPIKSKIETL